MDGGEVRRASILDDSYSPPTPSDTPPDESIILSAPDGAADHSRSSQGEGQLLLANKLQQLKVADVPLTPPPYSVIPKQRLMWNSQDFILNTTTDTCCTYRRFILDEYSQQARLLHTSWD